MLRKAPDTALADPTEVARWENLARPDFLALLGMLTVLVEKPEGGCPSVRRDGAYTVVEGGCVDAKGNEHLGRARITHTDGQARARLRDYGKVEGGKKTTLTGIVVLDTDTPAEFDIDLRIDAHPDLDDMAPGSTWLAIHATGRKQAGAWSMQGELATESMGRVRARATDIVLDEDQCGSEPLSGQLELWSGEHHVQIGYDGATDCDSDGTAAWWRDGVAQGELSGIHGTLDCSVDPRGGRPGLGVGVLALILLGLRRRPPLVVG